MSTRSLTAGPVEKRQAQEAAATLSAAAPTRWTGEVDGHELVLGHELSQILTHVVEVLAAGGSVTVGTVPDVVTTTAAARLLGISRTALMKHVESGALPGHKVGTHTRLRTADVMAYRKARLERQRAAFARLQDLEDALDDGTLQ